MSRIAWELAGLRTSGSRRMPLPWPPRGIAGRLKKMVRTSLEHSFLPGASLWVTPDYFYTIVSDCAHDLPTKPTDELSAKCAAFLASSERATRQWKLEAGFLQFEAAFTASP